MLQLPLMWTAPAHHGARAMPEPSTPRIFVSYARSDGKEFARELRRRLGEEHGVSLWHDLADMESGRFVYCRGRARLQVLGRSAPSNVRLMLEGCPPPRCGLT